MTSFIEALQNFDFSTADKAENVKITLGNGNNDVSVIAEDSSVTAGNGNNTVEMSGDDDSVLLGDGNNTVVTKGNNTKIMTGDLTNANSKGNNYIFQDGYNATISAGNGNNKIISYGEKATIVAGSGDNTIGSIGDDVHIGVQNGNNKIAFWGNNDIITTGNGNNNIKTLDWLINGPEAEDDTAKAHNKTVDDMKASQNLDGMDKDEDLQNMANQIWSSFQTGSRTEKKVTGTSSSTKQNTYTSGGWRITEKVTTTTTSYLNSTINYVKVNGVSNATINTGNGDNKIGLTVSNGKANITGGDGNNDVKLVSDYEHYTSVKTDDASQTKTETSTTREEIGKTWVGYDPLVIDFNQDGKISATSGQGIDLNGDGTADGAATGGDKMLAMSDINGNGTVDGAEVFGDDTVDPFTGKKLNAENGFDALAKVAESAEEHTGISCIDSDGNVNLADLKRALNTIGINLGFVSDANNTMLEELEKVASINTKQYSESEETEGNVHHAQQGTYTGTDGKKYAVHDLWFK